MYTFNNDLAYLVNEKASSFNSVKIETIFALRARSHQFKKIDKQGPQHQEYAQYRNLLKELYEESLPFRIIEKIKAHVKRDASLDIFVHGVSSLKEIRSKPEREEKLIAIANEIVSKAKEETLFLASKIRWLHGTNSSLLPIIPYADYTLLPTGSLLEKGIAPLSGEIKQGGLQYDGINQGNISGVSIRSINLSMKYALSISFSFNPDRFNEAEKFFESKLQILELIRPEDSSWDPVLIELMQFKQWHPEQFSELCQRYLNRVQALFDKLQYGSSPREQEILTLINSDWKELEDLSNPEKIKELEEKYPSLKMVIFPLWHDKESLEWSNPLGKFIDEKDRLFSGIRFSQEGITILCDLIHVIRFYEELLQKIVEVKGEGFKKILSDIRLEVIDELCRYDRSKEKFINEFIKKPILKRIEFNNLPYQRRLKRFSCLFFDKTVINLSNSDRQFVLAPFPLILASTKLSGHALGGGQGEHAIRSGTLGKEINRIFVEDKQIPLIQSWLKTHGLGDQVQTFSFSVLTEIQKLPCLPGKGHILVENPLFSHFEIKELKKVILTSILPLYKKPYPSGAQRIHHGPAHAMRTLFFSELLFIMMGEEGKKLPVKPLSLFIAAGLHDSAREDDGEDLWDKESGLLCQQKLEELSVSKEHALLLGDSIARKDSRDVHGLTYDLIHDADCIEILRVLPSTQQFLYSELRIGKTVPPEILHTVIQEAFFFIHMTENPTIKSALENSEDPNAFLFQILFYLYYEKKKCPQMAQIASTLESYVGRPSDYVLPEAVLKTFNESM